jgi:hypothetical protein
VYNAWRSGDNPWESVLFHHMTSWVSLRLGKFFYLLPHFSGSQILSSCLPSLCMCGIFIYVCMCVYVWYMCMCGIRVCGHGQVNAEARGFSLNLKTDWPVSSQHPLVSAPQGLHLTCWDYRYALPCLTFTYVPGIRTQVLLFAQQAILPTEPSLQPEKSV